MVVALKHIPLDDHRILEGRIPPIPPVNRHGKKVKSVFFHCLRMGGCIVYSVLWLFLDPYSAEINNGIEFVSKTCVAHGGVRE